MKQETLENIANIIMSAYQQMTDISIRKVGTSQLVAVATNEDNRCEVFDIKLSIHGQVNIRPVYFHFD